MTLLWGTVALLCALTYQHCVPAQPRIFVAEASPDERKLAYVKEYYASLLHYPVPVYPKYALVVRHQKQDHELYKIDAKEIGVRFVVIAWNDDSARVGFYLESWNANSVVKAFDTNSWREIPFQAVQVAARKQMVRRWARFIPPGTDPLSIAEEPSEGLARAFYNWRIAQFEARPGDKRRDD